MHRKAKGKHCVNCEWCDERFVSCGNRKKHQKTCPKCPGRVGVKKETAKQRTMNIVHRQDTRIRTLEKDNASLKHQTSVLRVELDETKKQLTRARGDIREHGLALEYVALRMRAIEKHYERTPLKFELLFGRVQDLECAQGMRKSRENLIPEYERPIRIDRTPGENGPEHRYRGTTLGEVESQLRTALKEARRGNLNEDERTHIRIKIRGMVNTLNKQAYTWPGGRPAIPDENLNPLTKPHVWRARGKSLKKRDAKIIRSPAPSPPELPEESKQPPEGKIPIDDCECPYQEPLPGKWYPMHHRVREQNNADLQEMYRRWRKDAKTFLRWKHYDKTKWERGFHVGRLKDYGYVLKKWLCEATGTVKEFEKEHNDYILE